MSWVLLDYNVGFRVWRCDIVDVWACGGYIDMMEMNMETTVISLAGFGVEGLRFRASGIKLGGFKIRAIFRESFFRIWKLSASEYSGVLHMDPGWM